MLTYVSTAQASGCPVKKRASMEPREKVWSALGVPAFRSLWIGNVAMNLAIWMQSVAAAWMMVSLHASPLMVALIQTAAALPSFLLGLPGGVMADMVDRRRYLLCVIGFMMGSAACLSALALGGGVTPWMLLALTFSLGCGFALQAPAWFTVQTESVPRALLPSALALSAVSFSSARAVGPAVAGAMISAAGVTLVFVFNVGLLLVTLMAVQRSKRTQPDTAMPPEDLISGMRSALRYVRHSDVMRHQIIRTVAFAFVASAIWALMPMIARDMLASGASGYGLLLGAIGAGSVAGALLLPRVKAGMDMNRMMAICGVVYGLATLTIAFAARLELVCTLLLVAGVAWVGIGNTNMLALQSAVPGWIRGRSVAIYMLVFQGAMAAGSAFWGFIAATFGTSAALVQSALLMVGVLLVMWRLPARMGGAAEVTDGRATLDTPLAGATGAPDAVVSVQIEYHIAEADREEFLRQIVELGKARRRDGASFWRLLRDLERDGVYMERFLAESWNQYLRQRSRTTVADRDAEQRLASLHRGSAPPAVTHFASERCL
jgi:MFS family permease